MQKEYTKPVVARVNLRPVEAVLSACKGCDEQVTGPTGGTCCEDFYELGGNCHVPGS